MRNHVSGSAAKFFVTGAMAAGIVTAGVDVSFSKDIVVGEGDTLSRIAREALGDAGRWPELCELNRDILGENCDVVIPGMVLNVPESAEMADDTAGEAAEQASTETEPEMDDAKEQNAEATSSDYEYVVSLTDGDVFNAPEGFSVNQLQNAGTVEIAGSGDEELPSYGRPGVWLQLPAEFEQAASGKTIKVTIVASLSSPGEVAFAYSTNDVGNSGWRRLELDETAKEVSFTYDVPALNNGGGDFLGVWPDPTGTGQTLKISGLKAVVF